MRVQAGPSDPPGSGAGAGGPSWASGWGGCPCRPSLGYVPAPVPPPMGAIPTAECATRQIPTERGLMIAIYNLVSTSTYDLTVVIHPSPLHADLCLISADWNRFRFR